MDNRPRNRLSCPTIFRAYEIVLLCFGDSRSLTFRVRSEELGTDAELGSATVSVIQAMGVPLDQPKV